MNSNTVFFSPIHRTKRGHDLQSSGYSYAHELTLLRTPTGPHLTSLMGHSTPGPNCLPSTYHLGLGWAFLSTTSAAQVFLLVLSLSAAEPHIPVQAITFSSLPESNS
jgi:hypothetical protein